MFSIIACIGKNRELGRQGKLIFHLKDDLNFFKDTTTDHPVVMGRKTWESLPSKLKNRKNIVISRSDLDLVKTPELEAYFFSSGRYGFDL